MALFDRSFFVNSNLNVEEDLESSPSFWTVALKTKCQKLVEPTIPRQMTDTKIKEKKDGR